MDEFKLILGDSLRSSKDLLDAVHKSLSGQGNSFVGDWLELLDVAIWHHLVLARSQTVINSHGDLVGLISKLTEVSGIGLSLREGESGLQVISNGSKVGPGLSSERSFWVFVIGVDNGIPNGVELVSRVVVLQREHVTSFISIREVLCIPITGMERLVDITVVVDQQSQSKGSTLLL